MKRTIRLSFRVSQEEKDFLEQQAKVNQFTQLAGFLQSIVLKERKSIKPTNTDFRYKRLQNRGFMCEEEVWEEIKRHSTPSQFIRQAIKEKLEKLQQPPH